MSNEWLILVIAVAVLVAALYGLYRLIAAAVARGRR